MGYSATRTNGWIKMVGSKKTARSLRCLRAAPAPLRLTLAPRAPSSCNPGRKQQFSLSSAVRQAALERQCAICGHSNRWPARSRRGRRSWKMATTLRNHNLPPRDMALMRCAYRGALAKAILDDARFVQVSVQRMAQRCAGNCVCCLPCATIQR